MRRASWMLLVFSAVALALSLCLPDVGSVSRAPNMSRAVALQIVERLVEAMKQRDVRPFLDLAAADASIFGARPEELRRQPRGTVRMFSVRRREVTWSDLKISPSKSTVLLTFDLRTVNVEDGGQLVRRGPFHVQLVLSKGKVDRLWGLYRSEEWQVVLADRSFRR